MDPLRLACFLAFLACILSFTWGMSGGFFRQDGKLGFGFRLIQMAGTVAFLINAYALLTIAAISVVHASLALALCGLSFFLFWWAARTHWHRPPTHAFSNDLPIHIVQTGPYKTIRHPFYSAYLIAWSVGPVATGSVLTIAPLLVMLAIYWRAAKLEEAKFAASSLSKVYSDYRSATGMLLPWM